MLLQCHCRIQGELYEKGRVKAAISALRCMAMLLEVGKKNIKRQGDNAA